MGIRGLKTFVTNKSDQCMESFELHDTNLVIDGPAIRVQLYSSHTSFKNGCFGGDYDKYGKTVQEFFSKLSQCNIIPYVINDGGYESRKMETILDRFKRGIQQAENLIPRTEYSSFTNTSAPLMMGQVFEEIAQKLGVKLIRCDFEGDREVANIAKELNCPVLSNDSDFYIFDVPYIPFSMNTITVETGSSVDPDTGRTITYEYIPCKIYRIDTFLKSVGDMPKENLPLFAALVGNNFMDGIELSKLGINFGKRKFIPGIRIQCIIDWLKSETKKSAIEKLLNLYRIEEREGLLKKIDDAINGYKCKKSKFLNYFLGESIDSCLDSDDDEDEYNSYKKLTATFPKPFLENFRKSLYPVRFMEILSQNKYFNFKTQIEVRDYEHAHNVSIDLITAVHKILTGSSENLICLARFKSTAIEQKLPLCNLDLPSFEDIQTMDLENRKKVFLKILNIDENFVEKSLDYFPDSWQVLVLTLKYMINKLKLSVVYSVVLCKLLIDYVDPQVGYCRSSDDFLKRLSPRSQTISALYKGRISSSYSKTLKSSLESITYGDAFNALSRLIFCFDMKRELLRDPSYFDRELMHSLSQFQSCLLHVKGVNQLLNLPFQDSLISDCYNGTFVYNMTSNLERNDKDAYLEYLLKEAPAFLTSFEIIITLIKE